MPDSSKNSTETTRSSDRHVMVVDDEKAIRGLAKRILTVKGYNVTTCADGAEAVDAYSRLYDQIDLVILDMIMPEMNGVETLRLLKQMDPAVRAILCSAYVPDFHENTIEEEGFVAFIAKPFQIKDLLSLTDKHSK